ncbi:uncharacterized protein LOC125263380 isoform X2 [Megalobrama amblycephala]|uniref:uncharacterized protein LOC125263380 isoform X2 n=1 Tax=Megalobrama amblycephala TaxID=75352 RepID=UPI0020147F6E|nr:uncharacterized protein LOC125263380 isoform X2 [Megalobrama amblycephala]
MAKLIGEHMLKKKFIACVFAVFALFVHGVSDTDQVSVKKGDSLTLHTDVQTNQLEEITWYFNNTRIAQINGDLSKSCTDVQCNKGTERFRDRLKLDHQTGSLTITNITNTDDGEYKLLIIFLRSISEKIFAVVVHGVAAEVKKRKSVKEGESVTLETPVGKNPNDVMTWYFNEILIAEITGDQSKICTDVQCDERFRDRLKLDHQTGSLTIMNTRNTDSGEYELWIIISSSSSSFSITSIKNFSVAVNGEDSVRSSGLAAGICVAVALLLVSGTVGGIYYCRKRSRNDEEKPHERRGSQLDQCDEAATLFLPKQTLKSIILKNTMSTPDVTVQCA